MKGRTPAKIGLTKIILKKEEPLTPQRERQE